jgi:hypothetical protein
MLVVPSHRPHVVELIVSPYFIWYCLLEKLFGCHGCATSGLCAYNPASVYGYNWQRRILMMLDGSSPFGECVVAKSSTHLHPSIKYRLSIFGSCLVTAKSTSEEQAEEGRVGHTPSIVVSQWSVSQDWGNGDCACGVAPRWRRTHCGSERGESSGSSLRRRRRSPPQLSLLCRQ